VMAPSDARIEYHFRATARLCLNGLPNQHSAVDRSRESDGRPGVAAPGFGFDIDCHTAAGRRGAQLTSISVALRLFHEEKTLCGTISADTGEIPGSMLGDGAYLPGGLALQHREAALCFLSSGHDRAAVVFARRQADVCICLDETLVSRIPMAVLAQLVTLGECRFRRTFKRSFGFLPRGFRIGLRIVACPEGTATREPAAREIVVTAAFVATGSVMARLSPAVDHGQVSGAD
jgi:hypothetical protein